MSRYGDHTFMIYVNYLNRNIANRSRNSLKMAASKKTNKIKCNRTAVNLALCIPFQFILDKFENFFWIIKIMMHCWVQRNSCETRTVVTDTGLGTVTRSKWNVHKSFHVSQVDYTWRNAIGHRECTSAWVLIYWSMCDGLSFVFDAGIDATYIR